MNRRHSPRRRAQKRPRTDGRQAHRPLRARRRERALRVVGSRRSRPGAKRGAQLQLRSCKHETVLVTLRAAPRSAHRRSRAMTNCAVRTQFPLSCVPPQQTSAYAGRVGAGSEAEVARLLVRQVIAGATARGPSQASSIGSGVGGGVPPWRVRPAFQPAHVSSTLVGCLLLLGWSQDSKVLREALTSTRHQASVLVRDSARSVLGPTVLSSARLPPGLPTPPRARTSRLPGNSSPRVWFSS